eukprot:IDg9885t1
MSLEALRLHASWPRPCVLSRVVHGTCGRFSMSASGHAALVALLFAVVFLTMRHALYICLLFRPTSFACSTCSFSAALPCAPLTACAFSARSGPKRCITIALFSVTANFADGVPSGIEYRSTYACFGNILALENVILRLIAAEVGQVAWDANSFAKEESCNCVEGKMPWGLSSIICGAVSEPTDSEKVLPAIVFGEKLEYILFC